MRRTLSGWVALGFLSACGGGAAPASPASTDTAGSEDRPDCATIRAREQDARSALDRCRAESPAPVWPLLASFEWLEEAIDSRLEAVRRGEQVTGGVEDMQAISERVWSLLDEVPEQQRDAATLGRVEHGAEALLHPHTGDARERALAELAGALGALRASLEPAPAVDPCDRHAREAAATWLNAQATCDDGTLE